MIEVDSKVCARQFSNLGVARFQDLVDYVATLAEGKEGAFHGVYGDFFEVVKGQAEGVGGGFEFPGHGGVTHQAVVGVEGDAGIFPCRGSSKGKLRVTLNTDNRLMSDTTMTREFEAAANTFGLTLDDFEKITINAMKSAFLPYRQRCDVIYEILKPGYAKIRELAGANLSIDFNHMKFSSTTSQCRPNANC